MNKPRDLDPLTDVAVEHVSPGVMVHKPGDFVTGCGQPMWAMQRPLPSAGHMEALCGDFCEDCWPHENTWEHLLALAYPSRFRTADINAPGDRHINTSYASADVSTNRRSRP